VALDTVQRDPRRALALAEAAARAAGDADEHAQAERAAGLALRELDDHPGALVRLRRAVALADRGGTARVAAFVRLSLAYVLAQTGRTGAALRAVDAALPSLRGEDLGRARMQRGVVLFYAGRHDEALREYTAAVDVARRHGDLVGEGRALNNRGLLQAYRGAPPSADADFDRATEVFGRLGMQVAVADTCWNRGLVLAQRGDVPRALEVFADVEREYRRLDVPRPALVLDRLELLLTVPLVREAHEGATAAVADLRRRGQASDLAEALLVQARTALLGGDLALAAGAAAQARRLFRRQSRETWCAFARHVELHAACLAGERSARLLAASAATADALTAVGWSAPALAARLDAARTAVALGRTDEATAHLDLARRARRGGTATRRAQGWYAEALHRRLRADPAGARRALARGLTELEHYRAALSATELRTSSGAHGELLAAEGLADALERRAPAQALAWAERWRAGALAMVPARPPDDPELAAALTALRAVSADVEQDAREGRVPHLLGRQAQLELEVRDLTRRASATGPASPPRRPPSIRALAAALGEAVLVELVTHDGRLSAVVVRDGRASLHALAPVAAVAGELEHLRLAVRRTASLPATGRLRAAARTAAERIAVRLDALLLAPLASRLRDRPLVVVPTGVLHAVPWSLLPSCAGRPVSIAPSATLWLRAATGAGLRRRSAGLPSWSPGRACPPRRGRCGPSPTGCRTRWCSTARGPRCRRWPRRSTAPGSRTSPRTAASARTTRCSRPSSSPTAR
jgi:tetratricopeptide (TPR) repeat protein